MKALKRSNGAERMTVCSVALAEAFKKAEAGKGPKRSIIFSTRIWRGKGLLGLRYYTDNLRFYSIS